MIFLWGLCSFGDLDMFITLGGDYFSLFLGIMIFLWGLFPFVLRGL